MDRRSSSNQGRSDLFMDTSASDSKLCPWSDRGLSHLELDALPMIIDTRQTCVESDYDQLVWLHAILSVGEVIIYIRKNARLCPTIPTHFKCLFTDFVAEECEKIRQKRATLAKVDEVCFEIGPLMTQSPFRNTVQSWIHTGTQDDDVTKRKHFPCCWPFVWEFTGHRWIPRTRASDAELLCFLSSAPK